VPEDDDDAGNTAKSVADATEDSPTTGATILNPIDPKGVTCKEESIKSENAEDEWEVFAEDEWEVVRDDDQGTNDEMLNCAELVIGSSLLESNMVQSNSSSSDVYDDDGVYDK
jgi:hypothetical protein